MTDKNSAGISRRTLAKGVAWTVPAVAMTAAAPAYATSPNEPPVGPDIASSSGCKWPGEGHSNTKLNKGFRIYIPFENNTDQTVTVKITGYALTAGGACPRDFETHDSPGSPADLEFNLLPGATRDFWITWHDDQSGNEKTLTVTYTVTAPDGTLLGTYSVPVSKSFNKTCSGIPEPTVSPTDCDGTQIADPAARAGEPSAETDSGQRDSQADTGARGPAGTPSPEFGAPADVPSQTPSPEATASPTPTPTPTATPSS